MSSVQTGPYQGTNRIAAFAEALREPEWMRAQRTRALARFNALSWPTTRDEEWRRSDISNYKFDDYPFGRSTEAAHPPFGSVPPDGYSGSIVFNGDECVSATIKPELAARGIRLVSLASYFSDTAADAVAGKVAAAVEAVLTKSVDAIDNRVQAWHYALWNRGVCLYVPEFVEVAEPFLISFGEAGAGELASPEIVVALEKGAKVSVVQEIDGNEDEIIYNEGTDFLVADAASLSYFVVQNLNIDSSVFTNGSSWVARDGSLRHFTAVFGGMFAKERFDCVLDGPGSDVRLDGMYFPHEDQHFDVRTVQHHNAPHAVSRTYYKGAVKDEAHAIYQGLIQVSERAVRTDAFLEDKNLLLSESARADSIPSLQINTDDVKCSHGSTTGKVDQRQVFYLMSRGYAREEAEELLVEGYFEDLIAEVPATIQERLRDVISSRILSSAQED